MRIDLFNYELPDHLIAIQPVAERDQSRLLVVHRRTEEIEHRVFYELPQLLNPGDLLVLNDTRVVPAQLLGRRSRTGGKWEGLFLRQTPEGFWELLCQTRGKLTAGEDIEIEPGLRLRLVQKMNEGHWLAGPSEPGDAFVILDRYGQVPLPPYIQHRRIKAANSSVNDRERYQTVYARQGGAVAAPTAGLHFTPGIFERFRERGIDWTFVTLHVGLGTFQPVQTEDITQHRMHREWGELDAESAGAINTCRDRGGRVVAVGTTVVRVLETAVRASGLNPEVLVPWSGETDLYIFPPYQFKVVDALVTNFHLPRSTLLLLVSAFAGTDLIRQAYRTAIEHEYRFYSYGDAMLIV